MTFSKQLRAARKAANLTQAEAAQICRVSKRKYEQWEAGESAPPFEVEAITRERVISNLGFNVASEIPRHLSR
jgi:transcriptional regulator with XRE-family HTH domain